ncbi:MAG: hypothetical protein H0X34_02365 [Chthoniobacterales bacterium]|nr:hypothetical protein [Chthoniobacterales bacterium]
MRKIAVSVKGGGIKPDDVRALSHVREREGGYGIVYFPGAGDGGDGEGRPISRLLRKPEREKYARLRLLTIEALLDGTQRAEHPDYEPDLISRRRERKRRASSSR